MKGNTVESIPDRAAAVLARHPSPAVSLQELALILKDDAPGRSMRPAVVLDTLIRCPERFRVVQATAGLRSLSATLRATESTPGLAAPRGGTYGTVAQAGPWILGLETPRSGGPATLDILRATLGYLGQRLDEESGRSVARWMTLVMECGRVGENLRMPRATPDG